MTRHGRRSRSRSRSPPPPAHSRRPTGGSSGPTSASSNGGGNRSSYTPSTSSSYQPSPSSNPYPHQQHDFAYGGPSSTSQWHRNRQPPESYPITGASRGRSRSQSRSSSRSRTLSRSRSRSRSPPPSSATAPPTTYPSSSASRSGAHGGASSRSAYGSSNNNSMRSARGSTGPGPSSSWARHHKPSRSRSPRRPMSSAASSHPHARSKSRDRDMYMVSSPPPRSRRAGNGHGPGGRAGTRGNTGGDDDWGSVYEHGGRARSNKHVAHGSRSTSDRRVSNANAAGTLHPHAREAASASASEDGELLSPPHPHAHAASHLSSSGAKSARPMRPPMSTRPSSSSSSTATPLVPAPAPAPALAPASAEPTGPEEYETLAQVGEGTYGKVFRARQRRTGTLVALKRVRIESTRDGFPITAVRELQLLQRISSANVVSLLDIALETTPGMAVGGAPTYVYMVFEYMQHDLAGILHHPSVKFTLAHVKSLVQQLLLGLAFLHRRGIVHRDVKGSNLLLNRSGQLKLADFGLARAIVPHGQSAANTRAVDLTNRVITLWYRPPELLLGGTQYGGEVDLWSTGCILLELFVSRPAFPGTDELSQLDLVFRTCGTPDARAWPDVENLPWWPLVRPAVAKPRRLLEVFADTVRQAFPDDKAPADGVLELMDSLLQVTPDKRPTAEAALAHAWFVSEMPKPEPPKALLEGLDDADHWHEFESKQRKRAAARAAAAAAIAQPPQGLQASTAPVSESGEAVAATPVPAVAPAPPAGMASAPVPPGSPVHVVTSVRVPKLPLAEPLPSAVAVNSVSRPSASTLAASAAERQAQLRNTRKSFVPTGALISFAFMPPPVVAPPPLPAPPQPSKPPVVDEVVKHETVHQAVTPSSPGTPAVSKPAGTGGGGGSARPPAPATASVQVKPGGIVVRQVRVASSDSSSLHAPLVPPPPLSSRSSSPPELALRGGSVRSPPPHASSWASSSAGVGPSLAKRARLMSPPGSSATTHTASSLASALGFPLPPIAASQANSPVVGGGATLRSPPPTGSKRA